MDPEAKKLLEDIQKLTEDNNAMLHRMRAAQKRATLWSILKWVVIIGFTLGSFYFLQPYVDKVVSLYGDISSTQQKIHNGSFMDLFKKDSGETSAQ